MDYINLMTFDYHTSADGKTGINSPLFADPQYGSINATTNLWIKNGASPSKLLLGLAFYGRSFTLADKKHNGLGVPSTNAGRAGQYSQEQGFLTYLEICLELRTNAWTIHFDQNSRTPYAIKGDQWISYDNPKSIRMKTEYAVKKGLAGVMVQSVDNDDKEDACGHGSNPLLNSIRTVIQI